MVNNFQDGYSLEAGWSYFIPSHSVWVTPYLESIERLVIGWPMFLHFSVCNKLCSSDRPLLFYELSLQRCLQWKSGKSLLFYWTKFNYKKEGSCCLAQNIVILLQMKPWRKNVPAECTLRQCTFSVYLLFDIYCHNNICWKDFLFVDFEKF